MLETIARRAGCSCGSLEWSARTRSGGFIPHSPGARHLRYARAHHPGALARLTDTFQSVTRRVVRFAARSSGVMSLLARVEPLFTLPGGARGFGDSDSASALSNHSLQVSGPRARRRGLAQLLLK